MKSSFILKPINTGNKHQTCHTDLHVLEVRKRQLSLSPPQRTRLKPSHNMIPQRNQWESAFHNRDIMTGNLLRMGALRLDDIE